MYFSGDFIPIFSLHKNSLIADNKIENQFK